MSVLIATMYGGLIVMSVLAAVFFLRYWRLTKDTFFLWFAGAFFTFAVNWALVVENHGASEHSAPIYGLRLAGFLQIVTAILLKNRRRSIER